MFSCVLVLKLCMQVAKNIVGLLERHNLFFNVKKKGGIIREAGIVEKAGIQERIQ